MILSLISFLIFEVTVKRRSLVWIIWTLNVIEEHLLFLLLAFVFRHWIYQTVIHFVNGFLGLIIILRTNSGSRQFISFIRNMFDRNLLNKNRLIFIILVFFFFCL